MYIKRWLVAPVKQENGELMYKEGIGTPQGGVISPLLANLYLHYAFDRWFVKYIQGLRFERYADDIIIHCKSKEQSEKVLEMLTRRMASCKLELHPEKTKIVYCKDHKRTGNYKYVKFDFLGFTFKPRPTKSKKDGYLFLGFDLAMSVKSGKRIIKSLRQTQFHRWTSNTIEGIAAELNPKIRGWLNYYGKFRLSSMRYIFYVFHRRLIKWITIRYKSLRDKIRKAYRMLKRIQKAFPTLFEHWKWGFYTTGFKMTRAV